MHRENGLTGSVGKAVRIEALEVRTLLSAPPNDMFADATVISSLPATYAATNIGATVEAGEPGITADGLGYSVWWKWTADVSGLVHFDTIGSEIDTVMAVFTGDTVSTLSLVASNDDYGGDITSLVNLNATAGTTYHIGVDVHWAWGEPGDFTFNAGLGGVANQPPVAGDDSVATYGWMQRTISVLDNDSDPDGDPLTVESASSPSHGNAVVNPDGTITYTAQAGYVGADVFSYVINDGQGNTATGYVDVSVQIPSIAHVEFMGTAGDDSIRATVAGDILRIEMGGTLVRQFAFAAVRDITLYGLGGNDTIVADQMPMGVTISGGAGNDVLIGSATRANWLVGGDGHDSIVGGAGDDSLDGGAGNDTIIGATGNDFIVGADGADVLRGGDGNDSVYGGLGDDWLRGGAGSDLIFGGDGNDTVIGAAGNDFLFGDAGNDVISGGDGNDQIRGGTGSDLIHGDGGSDLILGDGGADSIYGDAGNDMLDGGNGDDLVHGGLGDDSIVGGAGADRLFGDDGNDRFDSRDILHTRDSVDGGSGSDLAYCDATDLLWSIDIAFV